MDSRGDLVRLEMGNILALLKLALQNLAMILHALNINLDVLIRGLLRSRGVDVSVGEDVGRHVD
jgi:hypothetical protein